MSVRNQYTMTPERRASNKVRNERILELNKTMGPAAILRALARDFPGITRNMVISVVHRLAPKSDNPNHEANRRAEGMRAHHARRKADAAKALRVHKPMPITQPPKPRHQRPNAQFMEQTAPTPPVNINRYLSGPIEGSNPVPGSERTGCVWPFGERQDIRFCNEKKCRVRNASGMVFTTQYCAAHWDLRRTSRNTQILRDTA